MPSDENKFRHAFLRLPNIGSATLRALKLHFGSIEQAWHAAPAELRAVTQIRPEKTDTIISDRPGIDPDKEWTTFQETGLALLSPDDESYPAPLRQIPDRPETLYIWGNHDWNTSVPMIAIVGSRKFTAYGEQVAAKLAEDLTRAGFLVVSGLAFGIDSVSHEAALEAGGETIAILGSGLRKISPASHMALARKIAGRGAVVSEYPPTMEGNKWMFPERNRIIAGMTLGTVVVEAAEGSGSLITARCALEYNRDVFAVPGSIFSPYSIGTNDLIKQGAKTVTGVQDILEELPAQLPLFSSSGSDAPKKIPGLSPEEETALAMLSHEPLHIDKIITSMKLPTSEASSLLSLLEIKGLAKNVGGMHYIRM